MVRLTGGDQASSRLQGVQQAHLGGLVHVDLVVHDTFLKIEQKKGGQETETETETREGEKRREKKKREKDGNGKQSRDSQSVTKRKNFTSFFRFCQKKKVDKNEKCLPWGGIKTSTFVLTSTGTLRAVRIRLSKLYDMKQRFENNELIQLTNDDSAPTTDSLNV